MGGEGKGRGLLIAGGVLFVLGMAGVGIAFGLLISPASQDEIGALKSQLEKIEKKLEASQLQVQDEIGALKTQLIEIEKKLEGSEAGADQTGPSGLEQIVSSKSWRCPDGSDSTTECRDFLAVNILSLDVDRRDTGNGGVQANFWLAEYESVEDQGFVMSLGRTSTVWGVTLRNTHNAWYHDWSTKKFRVLGGATDNGPWEELHVTDLEDSRQQNPPPVQQIMFANPAVVSFIKFELLEYWGRGGGLQYFVPIYRAN